MQKKLRTDKSKSKSIDKKKPPSFAQRIDLSVLVSLAALSFVVFLPVLWNLSLNGDDAAQHYWWSKEFIHEIGDGKLYPRWLSGAYGGRGSPVLFYYPPVPFYAMALFYIFVRDPLIALYLGCCLGLLISGGTMFLYGKTFLSRRDSLFAAALYMTAHYHLFDFYQRLAQHEFWAFAWPPLLLYGMNRIYTEKHWRALPVIAVAYALLLMTHLPTALMFTFLLPAYALFLTRNVRQLALMAMGCVIGAGLAAISVFPFLFEGAYLKSLGARAANQYFSAGFLLEHLGSAFSQIPLPSSMNFDLFVLAGDWMAVGFFLVVGVCTWVLWQSDFKQNPIVKGLWVITVFSLLMATRLTTPLWQIIPKFRAIQFPIRWFTVVSLGASLLVAMAISWLMSRSRLAYPQVAALAIVVIFNLLISWLIIARAPFQPEVFARRISSYTDVREYHPEWWDQKRHTELDAAAAVVTEGKAKVTPVDDNGTEQSYVIDVEEDAVLKFRTLYFPGWQAQIDAKAVAVAPNEEGHIQIAVAQGEHQLILRLTDTPPRFAGKIISGLSFLILIGAIFGSRKKAPAAVE